MLGIDIIDLKDPLLKERTKRSFRLINHPEDIFFESENAFWLLWTAKEAVFKANRNLVAFTPKEIPVQIKKKKHTDDKITFTSGSLISGQIFVHDNLIAAIASKENPTGIVHHIFSKGTENVSQEARDTLRKFISIQFKIKANVIPDKNGLPVLDFNNQPVSFSHHGGFIAFACSSYCIR